jgi:spore coat protein CotH
MTRRRVLALTSAAGISVSAFGLPAIASARQQTGDSGLSVFLAAEQVHDISVTFDQTTYDAMIEALRTTGDKEWIEASVTIDGATYESVGMRLKGNSSLGSLGGGMRHMEIMEDGELLPAEELDEATPGAVPADDETFALEGEGPIGGGRGASADEPERLPWLVRLDRTVDGQNHEGLKEFVVRSNHSETSLNEAVALELLEQAGLASQRAVPARFTANDSAPALRLVIEHPNDDWMAAHFSADGLLYKAEAGGDFSYRGDDPADYADAFDLEAGGTGDDAADMAPLFEFLDFINNSDDDAFVAGLPERLDVDQFAVYLAMMDLTTNFDDITGPGNNAYLYVGPDSTQFEVVPWDMNLAFMGGDVGVRTIQLPDGSVPGEGTPVAGGDGMDNPPDEDDGETSRRLGPSMVENPLINRSKDLTDLPALQESTAVQLRAALFDSGIADAILEKWVEVLKTQAVDLVSEDVVTSEAQAIADFFTH